MNKESEQEIEKELIKSNKLKANIERLYTEIKESLHYAKRIQEAILPSQSFMQDSLQNAFVLYKPKDVVAGDFYWLEKDNGKVYFAAADCTGHGVPGAMLSVVCSNALSKALMEEKISETGKLLDRTRDIVIQNFSKSEDKVTDGMDISLCAINFEKRTLQWSGANNPIWIIRNNEKNEATLQVIKQDKQPVGLYENHHHFTTHDIQLLKDDTLYIFSDGFQDQFGGERDKKYMAKRLKSFILSIQGKSMNSQKKALDDEFERWRGENEQVDDVCFIGVRIN